MYHHDMMVALDSLALHTPDRFPAFPYDSPYSIQVDLMRHLYSSIERRHVTIVESPTGTGKTLSLLCASLSWLADEQQRARKGKLSQHGASASTEPAWVAAQAMQMRQRELEAQEREYEERMMRARNAEAKLRALARARVTKRRRVIVNVPHIERNEDAFLPDDSDVADEVVNISPAVRALMAKIEKNSGNHTWSEGEEPTCTKIYYASRTHSQLTQVLLELQKLRFPPILHSSLDAAKHSGTQGNEVSHRKRELDQVEVGGDDGIGQRQWRTVALGSRKQLCINEDVRSKFWDLDEMCRELQQGKVGKRCQHLPPLEEGTKMLDFRDQILAFPKDIEDLAAAGRNADTCPYYGSRKAIPQAELITLPYNLLLQKSARESLGIDLTNQIVIIDEAHNLIPTLLSLSSVSVTSTTLAISLQQVETYYNKFRNRFAASHGLHLRRLISYLQAMSKVVEEWTETKQTSTEVMSIPDYVQRLGRKVDGINLLEIETYLRKSKISRKISGYAEAVATEVLDSNHRSHVPRKLLPLQAVEAFILGLSGTREDGRIIFSSIGKEGNSEMEMKYLLLNPSTTFREIVESARSVVLAGGTMSPMSGVIRRLFPSLPQDRMTTFSCGHIIPQSHVRTLILTKGPSGSLLEFKYAQQSNVQVLKELGQVVLNLCNIVPRGLIVFFPSYSSLNFAKKIWRADRALERFEAKKKVFWEPEESSAVESTLGDYAEAVQGSSADRSNKRAGAILFAVVGAKLSEGLNFADDLARAVVVMGLPFANKNSPELQERMRYANEAEMRLGSKRDPHSKDAGSELYENMCMNAVNQSIGRAIRHRSDWASLILVDHRYSMATIRHKLPSWIQDGVCVCDTFGQAVKQLGTFYRDKKQ
ncbi:helicase C-terminal domain-containing protein [Pisolithus orientalis]|uniref:helicase C-terminal domain-containing protein n=1 Tax=Pisolithus orientalis TaxID=936130 RepID=UPI0022245495|nr:helicase C-terminal domain-containing protein [Pisolithus orientalis]KAI5995980.1 helicase C-terminal domain-containing protein [Pisolithus orientalis]